MLMYVVPMNTPLKKRTDKFKSRRAGYGQQWRDAMPGDLVMAFASDIKHPAVDAGVIHRNYILVGIVKSFVSVEWNTGVTDVDTDWNGITVQERLNVSWGEVTRWKKNSPNQPPHPHNSLVKVIALSGNGDLDKLNPQFKDMILQQFIFVRSFGWALGQTKILLLSNSLSGSI